MLLANPLFFCDGNKHIPADLWSQVKILQVITTLYTHKWTRLLEVRDEHVQSSLHDRTVWFNKS